MAKAFEKLEQMVDLLSGQYDALILHAAPDSPWTVLLALSVISRRSVSASWGSVLPLLLYSVVGPGRIRALEGRQALNQLSKELAGTQYDVITVEGHTDPWDRNERLSTRRAKSVIAYLVNLGWDRSPEDIGRRQG